MNTNDLTTLAEMAQSKMEMFEQTEQLLKDIKADLFKLQTETMPDAMMELGMSTFTLVDGTVVSIKPQLSGSIPSQGAIDKAKGEDKEDLIAQKRACLGYLRETNAGDLIKTAVTVEFSKEKSEEAHEFYTELKALDYDVSESSKVHAGSLNKHFKEQSANGVELPVELFKIHQGSKATFELPKPTRKKG